MASYSFNIGVINPGGHYTGQWKIGGTTESRAVYALAQPMDPGGKLITYDLGKWYRPQPSAVFLLFSVKNVGDVATNVRFDWGYA